MRTLRMPANDTASAFAACRRRADDVGALPAEHALVAGESAIEYPRIA